MVAPVDGSGEPVQIASAGNPSYLDVDGDWVVWTTFNRGMYKQWYANITDPGRTYVVDQTYHKASAYGVVENGVLYYLLRWPNPAVGRYSINIVVRDLTTGAEEVLPEFGSGDGGGVHGPRVSEEHVVVGVDQIPGSQVGLWRMELDGSDRTEIVPESGADAPVLGDYDATSAAVTFEHWPGDVPPSILQVPIDGGQVRPMSCATGVQHMVDADEGTRAIWLDGSYGSTALVVRDRRRTHC